MALAQTRALIKERFNFYNGVMNSPMFPFNQEQREEFEVAAYYWKELDRVLNGGKSKHSLSELKEKTVNQMERFARKQYKSLCDEYKEAEGQQKYYDDFTNATMTDGEWLDYTKRTEHFKHLLEEDMRLFLSVKREIGQWAAKQKK